MARKNNPEGYPVPHPRAASLGLRIRIEYDFDGDMYAIYDAKTGDNVDTGIISLDAWLDRYSKEKGE